MTHEPASRPNIGIDGGVSGSTRGGLTTVEAPPPLSAREKQLIKQRDEALALLQEVTGAYAKLSGAAHELMAANRKLQERTRVEDGLRGVKA